MSTQYYIASSLDGFIPTPTDSLDWLFQLGDINDTDYPEFIAGVGALAVGSVSYQWMLRNIIQSSSTPATAWPYQQPTWVFSSQPQ